MASSKGVCIFYINHHLQIVSLNTDSNAAGGFLRAIGQHRSRFKFLTTSCPLSSPGQGIMLADHVLLVNLSLKCLNLKELVSQEAAGGTGLGYLTEGLE